MHYYRSGKLYGHPVVAIRRTDGVRGWRNRRSTIAGGVWWPSPSDIRVVAMQAADIKRAVSVAMRGNKEE